MGLVLVLIIAALIVGGISLILDALWWLLVISAILFVAGGVAGFVKGRNV
jgi:hypothetical protein